MRRRPTSARAQERLAGTSACSLKASVPWTGRRESLSNAHAFTLLEILVAAALMGLLLALLVPVIRSVGSSAGSAKCTGSLRQLHAATVLYASDHDGRLPLSYWMGRIGPYLGMSTIDPSVTERSSDFPICAVALKRALQSAHTTRDNTGNDNSYIRTHSMNAVLSDTNLVPDNLKWNHISAPAKTVLFLDGHPEGGGYPYWRATVHPGSLSDIPGMFVHHGRAHVVFVDGHVKALTASEFPSDVQQSRFWNPIGDVFGSSHRGE